MKWTLDRIKLRSDPSSTTAEACHPARNPGARALDASRRRTGIGPPSWDRLLPEELLQGGIHA